MLSSVSNIYGNTWNVENIASDVSLISNEQGHLWGNVLDLAAIAAY